MSYDKIYGVGSRGSDGVRIGGMGSIARIGRAVQLIFNGSIPKDVVAFFPQGYSKEHPTEPRGSDMSLGNMMKMYLQARLQNLVPVRIISKPLSFGTGNDIVKICEMVREEFGDVEAHLYFVTDPVHLKRVRLIWRRVAPPGWTASFFAAPAHQMTWWERWVREPVARLDFRLSAFDVYCRIKKFAKAEIRLWKK